MKNKDKIARLLLQLGCDVTYKGFKYLNDIIHLTFENEDILYNMSHEVYPKISKKYNIQSGSVERDIRTLIKNCWNEDQTEMQNISAKELKYKPSVKQFISLIFSHLRYFDES